MEASWCLTSPRVLKMATLEGGKGSEGCLHQHRSGNVERRGVRESGSVLWLYPINRGENLGRGSPL